MRQFKWLSSSAEIAGAWRSPLFMTLLVLLGVMLRLWAYIWNKSFWLDELLLVRSILDLPLSNLLSKPLLVDQVAPRGFLLMERLAVVLLGKSELALRLIPFACAVAAVIVFRRLVERSLTGAAPALALVLFAIAIPIIRFSAEVKQYELDVAAGIGMLLVGLELRERESSSKRLLLFGVLGVLIVWFSQASVLVMAGLGLALSIDWVISRERRIARILLFTVPLWAAASPAAVIAGLRTMTPATREFMDDFWASGFPPQPLRLLTALRWFWGDLTAFFTDPAMLRYRWPVAFLIVALLGVVELWRRNRSFTLLLLGPFAVFAVAAVSRQYPFRGRLVICLLPSVLIALSAGAEWIRSKATQLHPILGTAVMVAFVVPAVMALAEAPPPYELEHHREFLTYLQHHRQPGDVIYVFPLERIGMLYYGPRYGLASEDWRTGICDRYETRVYIQDIDRFRGVPRLWLLSASARPFRAAQVSVQKYLSTIGVKKDSVSRPSLILGSASIELYDLSDPSRLSSASADTFPVPPMPTDPRPGCRDWVKP